MLNVVNINKNYEGRSVLNNINFKIEKGDSVGLIGLNGVGKTTLIKIILDLVKPNSGEIFINGIDNKLFSSRNDLAFLPEKFTPMPYLKGKEFLEISLGYFKQELNLSKAEELIHKLNLPIDILNKRVSGYSKGMAQKLGLISIILSQRPLWILDEPMSGLDITSRKELLQILQEHKANGGTFLVTSHLLNDLEKICNKIGVIANARMKFFGGFNEFNQLYLGSDVEEKFLEVIKNG